MQKEVSLIKGEELPDTDAGQERLRDLMGTLRPKMHELALSSMLTGGANDFTITQRVASSTAVSGTSGVYIDNESH